jgi:cytochrome P450
VLETMRRYPIVGNMTVRSVNKPDFELVGGYPVPVGVPIHVHMWSLHNTARTWDKPKDFNPDRWMTEDNTIVKGNSGKEEPKGVPRCLFMTQNKENSSALTKTGTTNKNSLYDGVGHEEGSLSFFPFSAGERNCPARFFSLQIIRKVSPYPEYHFDYTCKMVSLCVFSSLPLSLSSSLSISLSISLSLSHTHPPLSLTVGII